MLDALAVQVEYSHAGSDHRSACTVDELQRPDLPVPLRTIFLHRDPRDTAVSGFYQVDRRLGGYEGDLSDFLRDPRHGLEKICSFNLSWIRAAQESTSILPVTYEELSEAPEPTVRRVLEFLGVRRSSRRVRDVVGDHTFERMQSGEASGAYRRRYGSALTPKNVDDPDSFKVRRGKVGGFEDELGENDLVWCESILQQCEYPSGPGA